MAENERKKEEKKRILLLKYAKKAKLQEDRFALQYRSEIKKKKAVQNRVGKFHTAKNETTGSAFCFFDQPCR